MSAEKIPSGQKANCPVCGYFTGISSTCVRCGARINTKISIKAVRIISFAGAIAGLVLLWFAAYIKQPEKVNISDVTEMMNNALVVIEGEVVKIDLIEDKNTLKMVVSDGTGNINVSAFNKLDAFRKALGEGMPSLKDRVRVTGALNVSQAWGVSMFLSVPSRLEMVNKYIVKTRKISAITPDDTGDLVWIEAEVLSYEKFETRKGFVLHKFVLGDGSGEIEMVLFDTEFNSLSKDTRTDIVKKFGRFRMLVEISQYRGEPQVKIHAPADPLNIVRLKSAGPQQKAGAGKLTAKSVAVIEDKDLGNTYAIAEEITGQSLGADDSVLTLAGKMDLRIRYAYTEKIPGFDSIAKGKYRIKGPMKVVREDGRLVLRITDFDGVSLERVSAKTGEKAAKPPAPQKAPARKNYVMEDKRIDVEKLEKRNADKIRKKDTGSSYLVTAEVLSVSLGSDGIYLELKDTDTEMFVPYEYEDQIKGFSSLNGGNCSIIAPVRVTAQSNIILEVFRPESVRIE
ncbi:MAG: hypothetical protein JXJ19_10115 [Elusimicrobia bacterium]|nr:hypothetical protein [Elusimicrobiota bacterium]